MPQSRTRSPLARLSLAPALALGLALAAGCSAPSTAAEHGEVARSVLLQLRDGVSRASSQVQVVTSALLEVSALSGDVQEKVDAYVYAVTTTEKQAEKARARAEELKGKKAEYIAQWERELDAARDPEMKARMVTLKGQTEADFARVTTAMTEAGAAYRPWIAELVEIRTALLKDPAPAAIVAMRPKIASAVANSAILQTRLTIVLSEIDRMARLRAARLEY